MSAFDQFAINSKVPESLKTREEIITHIKDTIKEKFDSTYCNVLYITNAETIVHYGTFYIKVISWALDSYYTMTIYSCIPFQNGDRLHEYFKYIMRTLCSEIEPVAEPFAGKTIETINVDWFETVHEYIDFFTNTLTRWNMNPVVIETQVVCNEEGFAIEVKSNREINLLSNGNHIDSMIMEIFECLRIQKNTNSELTEDEAYALIPTDLKSMNEHQVQLYSYNIGRESREEINQWTVEHTGFCDKLLRVSYGKFYDAVICVDLKNLNNVCGASFKNCRIASSCHFENVTFVECLFDNVEFECALKNVKFDNCVLQKISWPTKNCSITVHNDEEDDDERSYSEYEDEI